jgi:hypothetical protein
VLLLLLLLCCQRFAAAVMARQVTAPAAQHCLLLQGYHSLLSRCCWLLS